jgi:cysteine desulfurase/selenocysteine lyase
VKYFDITSDGYLDTRNLDALITKKTVMVCLTHISNVLGTINPIRQLVKKIKTLNPKTLVLVDSAQSVPHMNINVGDLGCDFLAFSGHKMLGPTGIGILWGRYDLLDSIPPYQFGGDMIKEVHLYGSTYKEPPHKFEAGTPHISGAIGLGAACKYLKKIGMENVRNHEKELTRYALSGLSTIKNLTVYGPKDSNDKGGVLAFSLKGIHPHDLASILNSDNVCVRSGHHCAMPLHERLGLPATTRASLYIYNDEEDVDALVEGVNKAKKIFGI